MGMQHLALGLGMRLTSLHMAFLFFFFFFWGGGGVCTVYSYAVVYFHIAASCLYQVASQSPPESSKYTILKHHALAN